MLLQDSVKPISYVKAHAADILREVAETRTPIIITQNGEAKAVLQDIASYEEIQESLALLKILALSRKDVEEGRVKPAEQAFADIRERISQRRQE
ncbi:MAG: type II toxin-antitoxin system Phd/YefM family antitoxin [Desulfuromonadales bacterium]|nr:type II toxin-antitoxin system Phd/YefM family antitoxin [Desulfuromonadales bacterium]